MEPAERPRTVRKRRTPRVIDLKIDDVLWTRPNAPQSVPSSFETELDGWRYSQGEKTPIRMEGEPYLAVGGRYVLPIVYLPSDNPAVKAGWAALSPDTIFAAKGDLLGEGDTLQNVGDLGPLRSQFADKSATVLAKALQATEPDPLGVANPALSPVQRYQAAVRAERSPSKAH